MQQPVKPQLIWAFVSLIIAVAVLAACGDDTANLTVGNTANTSSNTQATAQPPVIPATTQASLNQSNIANNATTPPNATAAPTTAAPTTAAKPATPTTAASAITPITWAGRGTMQDQEFTSRILNKSVGYRIYLPPDYNKTTKRYPVLYMLHGLSGSYKEWVDYGLLNTTDDMIAAGQIPPFIIVLPLGEQAYWFNWANNGPRWGDYMVQDVIGHIDSTYRTIPNRENRAIGGHSMGGHGALQLAFNHPDVFGIVGSHSPTLRTKAQADDFTKDKTDKFWGDDAYYATIDPLSLAKSLPVGTLNSLKIYLDVGLEDETWRPRTEELNKVLDDRGIKHEWYLRPGNHGGEYWIAHVKEYITFYATSFPPQPS